MSYLYGFDLSIEKPGVTIYDLLSLQPVLVTSITTNKKDSHGKRLYDIAKWVLSLTEKYPPKVISIERGFSRFNTSTQVIYRVHGLINYLFHELDQIYYPPKKVKVKIIKGDATKKLVRDIIETQYPDIQFQNEDESDSFAVALTYLIDKGLIEWDKNKILQLYKNKKK